MSSVHNPHAAGIGLTPGSETTHYAYAYLDARGWAANVPDGYLVSPERYAQMREAEANAQRLHDTVPLLLAAAGAGAAIPSTTLSSLGIELPYDWRMINELQARVPVTIATDEEGASITRGRADSVSAPPEFDDELVLTTSPAPQSAPPPQMPDPDPRAWPVESDVADR